MGAEIPNLAKIERAAQFYSYDWESHYKEAVGVNLAMTGIERLDGKAGKLLQGMICLNSGYCYLTQLSADGVTVTTNMYHNSKVGINAIKYAVNANEGDLVTLMAATSTLVLSVEETGNVQKKIYQSKDESYAKVYETLTTSSNETGQSYCGDTIERKDFEAGKRAKMNVEEIYS